MGNFGSRLTGCGHLVPPARTRTIGHFQSYDRSGNRRADDRFQSAAAIGLRPRERDPSPKLPLTVLRPWSTSDGRCTSAVRSAEKALPTLSGSPSRRIRSRKPVRAGGGQKPAFSDPRGGCFRSVAFTRDRRATSDVPASRLLPWTRQSSGPNTSARFRG